MPPRSAAERGERSGTYVDTRRVLIRCGMEMLTEQGFAATGLEAVLRRASVPKGSFYHYFESKAAFGEAVLDAYDAYFRRKLARSLGEAACPALDRLRGFVEDAKAGMRKYAFARGCLVGNLCQDVEALPPRYRDRLSEILDGWEADVARCLAEAKAEGALDAQADCDALAEYFWIGWEGAVMRARLERSEAPLESFIAAFLRGLPRPGRGKGEA